MSHWQRHKFMALVGITILIALFLVGVAMALYSSSGAAQLDLSRPGYQSVREQASRTSDFEGYPATGKLDAKAISDFKTMYDKKAKEATAVDSFGGTVMTDQSLSIDAPAAQ
jgi:hypothetical protein